ncbi:hypothetical protein Tco_0648957 [Tanacetum coccineum]
MESDELIKSSVENLVPTPSESEDLSDIEGEYNVPVCDDFTTVSNPLFDADNDFSSSDDKSFSDEDVDSLKVFTQFPALGLPCATLSYNLSHRWGLGLSEMNWKGDIRVVVEWG